ncbi:MULTISPECIES: hypothetical protein [Halomicrobium]|uniref:Uncharacterized protein n=1 Tax=Halomicrobium mukohataei TaxID=57705 RepID=A0A4D6KBV0_9EURY|nr:MULTISPECIES: hypothetical protein [Halomicrobium]QCD65570.1 hypothetical protein E5139_07935 [Halomicrobium mukohataei]QFR20376.1 hypothetical protein GBQ70_07930 [Halomicrobium sp. ZPS1]
MASRRLLLKKVGLLSIVSLSGCINKIGGSTDGRNVPTVTQDCDASARPDGKYPSFPREITRNNVEGFVLKFEKAWVQAEINDSGDNFSGFDGWDSSVYQELDNGFFVTTRISADYSSGKNEEGGTDLGSEVFSAWYYINSDFAFRSQRDTDEPPNNGWQTVACA